MGDDGRGSREVDPYAAFRGAGTRRARRRRVGQRINEIALFNGVQAAVSIGGLFELVGSAGDPRVKLAAAFFAIGLPFHVGLYLFGADARMTLEEGGGDATTRLAERMVGRRLRWVVSSLASYATFLGVVFTVMAYSLVLGMVFLILSALAQALAIYLGCEPLITGRAEALGRREGNGPRPARRRRIRMTRLVYRVMNAELRRIGAAPRVRPRIESDVEPRAVGPDRRAVLAQKVEAPARDAALE
jgi:hypothetical protein